MRIPPPISVVREMLILLGIAVICRGAFMFSIGWSILGVSQLCYYGGAIGIVAPGGVRRAVRRTLVCEVWHQDDFEENQLVILPVGVPATDATTIAFTSDKPFAFRWRNDQTVDVSVPVGAWLREYRYNVNGVRIYLSWTGINATAVPSLPIEHPKSTGVNEMR